MGWGIQEHLNLRSMTTKIGGISCGNGGEDKRRRACLGGYDWGKEARRVSGASACALHGAKITIMSDSPLGAMCAGDCLFPFWFACWIREIGRASCRERV